LNQVLLASDRDPLSDTTFNRYTFNRYTLNWYTFNHYTLNQVLLASDRDPLSDTTSLLRPILVDFGLARQRQTEMVPCGCGVLGVGCGVWGVGCRE